MAEEKLVNEIKNIFSGKEERINHYDFIEELSQIYDLEEFVLADGTKKFPQEDILEILLDSQDDVAGNKINLDEALKAADNIGNYLLGNTVKITNTYQSDGSVSYGKSIDTPTNVVDVGNVHDNPNYKVSLNVDNNGNVIIYRSTNTPDRFSDTDFSKFEINKTIGEQTYFASNPEFAQSFSQSGKRNIYSFSTNIKPEEILHLQSNIYENKELLNKLGGQEYINNIVNERGINNYRFNSLDNIPKTLTWSELYYSTNKGRTDGSKEILQREIVELQNNGVKAIGVSPVSGAKNEYNILPIINEQSQLDIVAKGLIDENLKETPIDIPTNVDIPDTVPEDLVNEVDRDRLREFLELAEPEGTVEFTAEEIAEQADLNAQSRLTPEESNTFADIVENLNNQADDLPVDKAIKQRFKDKVTSLTTRLLTPGGLIDYVDIYETAVLGLGMVIAAAPELKNFANTYAHNYWNNLAASHGVAAYNQKEYEPNWERINDVMNVVEKISPTDMLINKIMDAETDTQYVSAYLPTGIDNTNISEKLKGTLSFMREKPVNADNESDKLKEAFIYGNTK